MSYYVYILSNEYGSVLYVGVTNDLRRRTYEHKHASVEGFAKKYHVHRLLYFEETGSIPDEIACEKQIKKYSTEKKLKLIDKENPARQDLYVETDV